MKLPQYEILKVSAADKMTLRVERIPLVTCDECRHMFRTMFMGNIYLNCKKRTEHVKPDGFCDAGEVRDEYQVDAPV